MRPDARACVPQATHVAEAKGKDLILRPWKRIRDLERALHATELVVVALPPPRSGSKPHGKPRVALRADLMQLALSTKFLEPGQTETEILRGAVSVRLERKPAHA